MSHITICQAARFGDIVNILPIAKYLHDEGNIVDWIIHPQFASILESVSYVNPIIWNGLQRDVIGMVNEAKRLNPDSKIIASQIDRNTFPVEVETSNFITQQYARFGAEYLGKFHDLPLVFDKRDIEAENKALEQFLPKDDGRPLLLYNFTSHSSGITLSGPSRPYYNKIVNDYPKFLEEFQNYRKLNIGLDGQPSSKGFKLDKPQLLLPFLERAAILISVDSLPIHLAYATKTPTIVLSVKNKWYQSEPRSHWVAHFTYEDAAESYGKDQISGILGRSDLDRKYTTGSLVRHPIARVRRVLHGVSWWEGDEQANSRNLAARATWEALRVSDKHYDLKLIETLSRDSSSVGDDARLPFVRDIFDLLVKECREDGIVLFTNTDIHLTNDALAVIRRKLEEVPCAYAARRDIPKLNRMMGSSELANIKSYSGNDLFCFLPSWWKENREILPDMLLGREGWDWVLRRMMKYEYSNAEITIPICYHVFHPAKWALKPFINTNKGQIYNRNLARLWAIKNGFEKCMNIVPDMPLFKEDNTVGL